MEPCQQLFVGLSRKGKYLAVAMPFGNKKTPIEDDLSESAKEKKPINQQHVLKVYSQIILIAKKGGYTIINF